MSKKRTSGGTRRELITTPAYLVAIARAAHLAGDADLSKTTQDDLRKRFGISITFHRENQLTTGARMYEQQGAEQ